MTRLSPELLLFPTPWHWFVHGMGLGLNPTGFDARRAAQIRGLARAVRAHHGDGFPAFVAELVDVILASCDPSSPRASPHELGARLARHVSELRDPRDHARACATSIESLVKLGLVAGARDRVEGLRRQLFSSLARIATLPAPNERARYEHVHLIANLLLAVARAGWTDLLPPAVFEVGAQLLGPVDDLFYFGRAAASWATALAVVRPGRRGDPAGELLGQALDRVDAQLDGPRDRPSDGAHEGRDYVAFAMFLTLGAIGIAGRTELLDDKRPWLEVAAADLRSLHPRARSSQTLLYIALLRNLGLLERHVPDPAALVATAAAGYLATTDGHQHDDYLRCTYLLHIARQLGCLAALPPRIGQILATSSIQLGSPSPHRATPYGSPLMFVAYVLSATYAGDWEATHPLWNVDLTAVLRSANPRPDDVVCLPRIGFALIDAALCLRTPAAASEPGADPFSRFAANCAPVRDREGGR